MTRFAHDRQTHLPLRRRIAAFLVEERKAEQWAALTPKQLAEFWRRVGLAQHVRNGAAEQCARHAAIGLSEWQPGDRRIGVGAYQAEILAHVGVVLPTGERSGDPEELDRVAFKAGADLHRLSNGAGVASYDPSIGRALQHAHQDAAAMRLAQRYETNAASFLPPVPEPTEQEIDAAVAVYLAEAQVLRAARQECRA